MHADLGPLLGFLPLIIMWWCIIGLFMMAYRVLLVILVCRDTMKRQINTALWGVLVGIFGTMAVVPYLIVREDIKKKEPFEFIADGKKES